MISDNIILDIKDGFHRDIANQLDIKIDIDGFDINGLVTITNMNEISTMHFEDGWRKYNANDLNESRINKVKHDLVISLDLIRSKKYKQENYSIEIIKLNCTSHKNHSVSFKGNLKYYDYLKITKNVNNFMFDNLSEDLLINIIHNLDQFNIITFVNAIGVNNQKWDDIFHNALLRHPNITEGSYKIIHTIYKSTSYRAYTWYHVYVHCLPYLLIFKYINENKPTFDYSDLVYAYITCKIYPIIFECALLGSTVFPTYGDFFYQINPNMCSFKFFDFYKLLSKKDFSFIEKLGYLNYYETEKLVNWAIDNGFCLDNYIEKRIHKNVNLFEVIYNKFNYEFSCKQIFKTKNIHFVNWLLYKDDSEDNNYNEVVNIKGKYNFTNNIQDLNSGLLYIIKNKKYKIKFIMELINLLSNEYTNFNRNTYIEFLIKYIRKVDN